METKTQQPSLEFTIWNGRPGSSTANGEDGAALHPVCAKPLLAVMAKRRVPAPAPRAIVFPLFMSRSDSEFNTSVLVIEIHFLERRAWTIPHEKGISHQLSFFQIGTPFLRTTLLTAAPRFSA